MKVDSGERTPSWFARLALICSAASLTAYFALSESLRVHIVFLLNSMQKVLRALS